MSTHVVVARMAGLAGRAAELRTLLTDRAQVSRGEPGCVGYDVAELLDEPVTFLVVEMWASTDAMRAHFGSPDHAAYQLAVGELLARPSEVALHDVGRTTRPAPSTSPTDPGRFG
jgi:quinol monooxygenase YgiN